MRPALMNMKRIPTSPWSMILPGVLLLFAHRQIAFAQNAEAQLTNFFNQYLDEAFQLRPMDATRLGDHRFDHLLDDVEPKARERWTQHTRQTLEELPKRVDYQKLPRSGQIEFEIFRHELTKSFWLDENTQPFEDDPRTYNDYINDSIYVLLTQSTLPKETNIAHCVARMARIPQIVAVARANLKNPPRVPTETAIRQNRGAIAFFERDIFELTGKTRQLAALKEATAGVVDCLKEHQKFLEEELLPRAHGNWRLGKEKFARKLELVLDAGVTADQVLSDAESEFARVERDMYIVARQLWSRYYPVRPLPPDDPDGRRSTLQQILGAVAQEHGRAEDLTRDVRKTVAQLKKFIS